MSSKPKVENPQDNTDVYKLELQKKAGAALLRWLDYSANEEFIPEDYNDRDVRNLKAAYGQGYNDCRAEAMQKVASFILTHVEEEDEDCDCCED
jgi:hypothetical protein